MKAIKLFSKALLSRQMLVLITTILLLNSLIAFGQSEDLSKRIKIQELTIYDLKQDNRNCVIMNQVLGDEIKQGKDTLNKYRFKLSKSDSTVNVREVQINALQSEYSRIKWAFVFVCLIAIALAVILIKKLND